MSPLVTESSSRALDAAIADIPERVRKAQWRLVRLTAHDIRKDRESPPLAATTTYWRRYLRDLAIPDRGHPVAALRHNMLREADRYRKRHGSYMGFIDARAMLVVARFYRRLDRPDGFKAWRRT